MKNKVKKYSIIMSVITLVLVSILAIQVNAEEPATGSITIIAHEQHNDDTTTNPPMEGVEYIIYKVDETCEDTGDAYRYIETNLVEGVSKTTGEDGTVIFDNLELGRYYIIVNSEYGDCLYHPEDFLLDIPMTNSQGNGWDYDIVVEPKIETVFSNLELTKVDTSGKPIEGVTFRFQSNITGEWEDYIPYGKNEKLTLTTNEDGKIKIENLPFNSDSWFRLLEESTPNGYIINNGLLSMIEFYQFNYNDNKGKFYEDFLANLQYDDYTVLSSIIKNVKIENDLTSFTLVNEKPEIFKKVQNSNGEFVDNIGANAIDKLTFKVIADVPMQIAFMKTYKITDELPDGIILNRDIISTKKLMVQLQKNF